MVNFRIHVLSILLVSFAYIFEDLHLKLILYGYGKCPKISYTKVSDYMAGSIQFAIAMAGSTQFAISLSISRNNCIKSKI